MLENASDEKKHNWGKGLKMWELTAGRVSKINDVDICRGISAEDGLLTLTLRSDEKLAEIEEQIHVEMARLFMHEGRDFVIQYEKPLPVNGNSIIHEKSKISPEPILEDPLPILSQEAA